MPASLITRLTQMIGRQGMTPVDAADAIFELDHDTLVDLVRPLIVQEGRRYVRSRTRRIEHRVSFGDQESRADARIRLARESFSLPDGRNVRWLDATVDDHLARAAWQRVFADSCIADAELHEKAAAEIEAAGVTCLREIET